MKVRFLQPVDNGRKFAPGDVAYIPDADAQSLIACQAAEAVPTIARNTPIRVSIVLHDKKEAA